jgi:hypothetical protein
MLLLYHVEYQLRTRMRMIAFLDVRALSHFVVKEGEIGRWMMVLL